MSRLLMYTCKCDFKSLMNSIFKINNNLTAIIIHYDHVLHLIWKESYFGGFFILLMKTALNFVYTYNVVLFNWSSFSLHWLFLQLKERNMPIFEIYFVAISLCFKVQSSFIIMDTTWTSRNWVKIWSYNFNITIYYWALILQPIKLSIFCRLWLTSSYSRDNFLLF